MSGPLDSSLDSNCYRCSCTLSSTGRRTDKLYKILGGKVSSNIHRHLSPMSALPAEKQDIPVDVVHDAESTFHASNQAEQQPSQVQQRIRRWLSPFSFFRVLVLAVFVGLQVWHTDSLLPKGATTAISSLSQWRHHPRLLPELYSICSRTGRNIYTSDEQNEWTQCVTVRNGTIVDVGDLSK